jgi:hypothetical protein
MAPHTPQQFGVRFLALQRGYAPMKVLHAGVVTALDFSNIENRSFPDL